MDDLIIIGAGPAGITAAVYAARKNLAVTIVSDNIGGQALYSSAIENYLGYQYITGQELVQKFEEHLKNFKIRQEFTKVSKVERDGETFVVVTTREKELKAKALLIASGKIPRRLGVPGEKEFAGRGVAYCATCDGPMFAGMDVAVIGGGNSGFDAAVALSKIATKVYILEAGGRITADEVFQDHIVQSPNAEIRMNTVVKEIVGEKFVKKLVIQEKTTGEVSEIPVGGIFVEIGWQPTVDFVRGLVALNDMDEIIVDCACRTSVPGIFAAGDVTNVPEKQIIVAAGEGAKAALTAYSYLIRGGK